LNPARSTRGLILGVAITTVALVAASRWAGRAARPGPDGGTPEPDAALAEPGAPAEAGVDFSFYRTLGGGRPGGSRETAGLPAGAPPPGDPPPAGAFVVQALATRDGRAARRLRDRLAAQGMPATLVEAGDADGPIFRVRVGRYRDRARAEAVARRVREAHGLESWVLRESE